MLHAGSANVYLRRIDCWADTRERAAALVPAPPASWKWSLATLPARPPDVVPGGGPPDVTVEDADSLACAVAYARAGRRPVVLNLADDCFPGGCVDTGSGAQEESLFRCTDLCRTLTLETGFYPLARDELVYSPRVRVLKAPEAEGWRPLGPPYDEVAVVTCPGIRQPVLDYPEGADADADPQDARLRPADEQALRVKVRLILRCAAAHGHDVVVLGALGCGAWKNPGKHVADVFAGVLAEPEFGGRQFERVAFAVLRRCDDMYIVRDAMGVAWRDNHDIFEERFRGAWWAR